MDTIEKILVEFKIELTEAKVTPENLRKWNPAQWRAWLQFVKKHKKEHKVHPDDLDLLGKYAGWFREHYLNKSGNKIPTNTQIPGFSYILNYKTKRKDSY